MKHYMNMCITCTLPVSFLGKNLEKLSYPCTNMDPETSTKSVLSTKSVHSIIFIITPNLNQPKFLLIIE